MNELAAQFKRVEAAVLSKDKKAFKREHGELVKLIEEKEKQGYTQEQINNFCFEESEG